METALTDFDVSVGPHAASDVTGLDAFTLCHRYSGSLPVAGSVTAINCDNDSLQGRYVAVIRRDTDVTLQFCELEVVAAAGDCAMFTSFSTYCIACLVQKGVSLSM